MGIATLNKVISLVTCVIIGFCQYVSAQSVTQLKAEGFIAATGQWKNHYVLIPGNTVPFTDVYLGNVEVSIPPRKKGEGPMVSPVRVLLDGKLEVNPASAGVFISPTTKKGWLRVHWTPNHLKKVMAENEAISGPGFGLVGGEEFVLEDGSFASQFYVPNSPKGGFVTGSSWGFLLFTTQEARTVYLKSEEYTLLKKQRETAKEEEKPKSNDKKEDGKKPDEKKDDKKKDDTPPTSKG